jgi:glycosyltransferase involved in cell wall biosynthesis
MEEPRDILVSGWRFILHSYAVAAQFLCLELQRRAPGIRLFFEDRPYHLPSWRAATGLFGADDEASLRAIPPPPAGLKPDAELRIAYPYDLSRPARAVRTVVFGTAEFLDVPPGYIAGEMPVAEAQQASGVTLLAPSNWSKQGFIRRGVPEQAVAVVPLGFDPAIFRPATRERRMQIRRDLGFLPEDFIFLHAGAMTSNKGLRFLLPAFAELLRVRPHARLVLKGADGLYPSRMHMESQLAEMAPGMAQSVLGRLIYMDGQLSFTDMARLYQASDCYVSSYVAEGFNMPVLEAGACGLPVICTAGGPTDDFVTADFALRIRSSLQTLGVPDQPAAKGLIPELPHLLQLMLRMTDDAAFRASAREAGPKWMAERFTWSKVVDRLLPVLLPR